MYYLMEKWDTVAFLIYNFFACLKFYCFDRFRYYKQLQKIKELKNKYYDQRCFIALNGPSLGNYDLSKITNEITFCSNLFYRTKYYDIVSPNYYCLWDSKIAKKENKELFDNIVNKDTKFIFNKRALKLFSKEQQKKAYFVYGMHMPNIKKIRGNIAGLSSSFVNVSSYTILCAIYMGFKDIYILGLDFEPGLRLHCYENTEGENKVTYDLKTDEEFIRLHYWSYHLAHSQSFYLNKYAKKNRVNIYNVNPDSYIKAFDFVDYGTLFDLK